MISTSVVSWVLVATLAGLNIYTRYRSGQPVGGCGRLHWIAAGVWAIVIVVYFTVLATAANAFYGLATMSGCDDCAIAGEIFLGAGGGGVYWVALHNWIHRSLLLLQGKEWGIPEAEHERALIHRT
jgi:hypothetical protein